jgi:hypothetical protein
MMTFLSHGICRLRTVLFCLGLLAIQANPARSDEVYEFVSIRCLPELRTVQVDVFRLWNVRFYVWQNAPRANYADLKSWERANRAQHIENLRRLEESYGIYVIDEAYGRWDDQPLDCPIGSNTVRVSFQKREMEGNTGEGIRAYRGGATISIVNKAGKVVWQHAFRSEHATFQVSNGGVLYVLCDNGQFCDPQNYQSADFNP